MVTQINKLLELPILYSFRRCPYAIRTRMVLYACGIECELREVVLKDKPQAMLDVSPKATVPVLVAQHGIIDESIDIIRWALEVANSVNLSSECLDDPLVKSNDGVFKHYLDRYKYFDRFPEQSQQTYLDFACQFVAELEGRLEQQDSPYLGGNELTALDFVIFPFIRQFAFVDKQKFDELPYPLIQRWLLVLLESALFKAVMQKYPAWQPGQAPLMFGKQLTK